MQQSRSFLEYVNNHLSNKLFNALREYIEEADPATLDLRLNKIRDIGRIEPDDAEVKFVKVSDLPGSKISFDVVVDAPLIVYDEDFSYNDETEYVYQWFTMRCRGDLDNHLDEMEIYEIGVYTGSYKREQPMSNGLVPIINKNNLDDKAEEFLKKYYPEALKQPMWLDPEELARRMNLTVLKRNISEDGSIFGQVFFRETETKLYDCDARSEVMEHVLPGTVIVDPSVAFQRNLGAYNNTIVHECVHWELHKKAFALEELYNEDASNIKCKVVGGIDGQNNEDTRWMEWQANSLAPRIQMPLKMFKRKANETIKKYRDKLGIFELCELMPYVIEDLATFFAVSRTSAKIRMIDVGYEEAAGSFIFIDDHYVRPHAYKRGAIGHNQTYSIPAKDAARQSLTNPKLQNSSHYVYVDSHFVLNHPRYVYKNADGETLMTDYARYHIDECCLAFDLILQGGVEKRYHSECFLNRDKGSPANFDIVYSGENNELNDPNRINLIHDLVEEETEVYKGLPNDFTEAWRYLLKWRGISQAELSRRTGISEKTIGKIINRESEGTLENHVLMCLGAHLPWEFSDYILQRSPFRLTMTDDNHIWYRYVLKNMYTKDIKEIQKFLHAQGAATL